jgi:hypothetical protein
MLNLVRKTWLQTAAVTIAWAAIQPGIVFAQNSGVAGDGTMRLMWRGTDSHISLWKFDASSAMNSTIYREHGPYNGWQPIALTTANNNNSYVLWRHTNGSISLWLVDANLNYVTSRVYGPYDGWIAESLSVETIGGINKDRFRVIWRNTSGAVSLWLVDASLNLVNSRVYGPYFGWTPSSGSSSSARASSVGAAAEAAVSGGEADPKAAAAMALPSGQATQMPEQ